MRVIGTLGRVVVLASVAAGAAGCPSKGGGGGGGAADVPITVIGEDGLPAVGVSVYTHSPSGALRDELSTDAGGSVTADVPTLGMVTVVYVDSFGDAAIRTVAGVKIGDELEFDFGFSDEGTPVANPLVAFDSDFAGTDSYEVDAGECEGYAYGGETTADLEIYDLCVNGANTYDVLVTATDINNEPIAYALLEDVAVAASTANMPAWSTAFATQDVTISNAPDGSELYLIGSLEEEGGFYELISPFGGTPITGGAASGQLKMPGGFGTGLQRILFVADGSFSSVSLRVDREGTIGTTKAYDFATDFLPPLQDVQLTGTVRPELSWSGTPSGMDYRTLGAEWDDGSNYYYWDVTAPPSTSGSFTFPELPAGVLPDQAPDSSNVYHLDLSWADGYDDVRAGIEIPTGSDYSARGVLGTP